MGEAVRNSGIPREEIFVITKLYPNQFSQATWRLTTQWKKRLQTVRFAHPYYQENTELFDFELMQEKMERINALDRGEKHDWY